MQTFTMILTTLGSYNGQIKDAIRRIKTSGPWKWRTFIRDECQQERAASSQAVMLFQNLRLAASDAGDGTATWLLSGTPYDKGPADSF